MLEHGGQLQAAAQRYRIPAAAWIDLSTGINPNGWSVPSIPPECWQRLPESGDELLPAAQDYYRNTSILAVAGSQAALQTLPLMRSQATVGVIHPAYAEHAYQWRKAGHKVVRLNPDGIEECLPDVDVLVVVNPNNPTGHIFDPDLLLDWHAKLRRRQGWLVIDEAFVDSRPEFSLAGLPVREGLIILRSIGKFFGLAGIRCGFAIGTMPLLQKLNEYLGPWTLNHPARYVAAQAYQDLCWQQHMCVTLPLQSQRLRELLSKYGLKPKGGTDLFQWLPSVHAESIHRQLAKQGILTRFFDDSDSIRFGLPKNDIQFDALENALARLTSV